MISSRQLFKQSSIQPQNRLIFGIVFLWGIVAATAFTLILAESAFNDPLNKYYLLPWCLATGIVVVGPSVYLIYKGEFNLLHPLVFAAWTFFFPGFFVGGLCLASGLTQPYFLAFIQDETFNLPLTFVYAMLGYLGLTAGYMIPHAWWIGQKISQWLPKWEMSDEQVAKPSLVLLLIGIGVSVLAFRLGAFGYQRVLDANYYDGLIFLFSLFFYEASFLLSLYLFRCKRFGSQEILICFVLVATSLSRAVFQGNRSGLIPTLLLVIFAYILSGRRITIKFYLSGAAVLFVTLIAGMIYGTTFRNLKQSEGRVGFDEYSEVVAQTFQRLSSQNIETSLNTGLSAVADRIDAVSSLAVVVSNYESLALYEDQMGISNNIVGDTLTFFIPRLIWRDKPVAIEPSKYADLYFNYQENSFIMTPMGDLLRNFGPIGVP
ncbi:MAG TPA: hypothetical protein VK612_08225, partial [Pyrinomonadaceae bacterium]|nr:hypothetical protein [Pyrinomonadaceae bacterium]